MARMRGLYEYLFRGLKKAGVTKVTIAGETFEIKSPEDLREVLMKLAITAAKKIAKELGYEERPGRAWFKILKVVLGAFWKKMHELARKARKGESITLPSVDEIVSYVKSVAASELATLKA